MIAATDPLAYLQAPTVGSCAHTNFSLNGNNGSSGSPYQLYSGTYCGGISVHGNAVLKFNAGTYVLAGGGMNINANTTMTGTGVTFYNTTGTGGYGAISLTATRKPISARRPRALSPASSSSRIARSRPPARAARSAAIPVRPSTALFTSRPPPLPSAATAAAPAIVSSSPTRSRSAATLRLAATTPPCPAAHP